jgi:threonine dehydrogenase-like Zn-dependent dehydrogenase
MQAKGLWYVDKERVELRPQEIAEAGADRIVIRSLYSGISRGTERLVSRGLVPASERQRMRCPHQEGDFPFPVKYGYALVGVVQGGWPGRIGQSVFVLHPHQDLVSVPQADAHLLPPGLPARRAALAANAETALNILWDAEAAPGDRILVVGGGVVGLLVAGLATRIVGTEVTVTDLQGSRAAATEVLGAKFAGPESAPTDQDIVIHTSSSEAGLRLALDCAGDEATVVEASWYGDRSINANLGGSFHSRRLRLISSQVGSVPAGRARRWSRGRRLDKALALLADPAFEVLLTDAIPFDQAPARLPGVLTDDSAGLMTLIRYP